MGRYSLTLVPHPSDRDIPLGRGGFAVGAQAIRTVQGDACLHAGTRSSSSATAGRCTHARDGRAAERSDGARGVPASVTATPGHRLLAYACPSPFAHRRRRRDRGTAPGAFQLPRRPPTTSKPRSNTSPTRAPPPMTRGPPRTTPKSRCKQTEDHIAEVRADHQRSQGARRRVARHRPQTSAVRVHARRQRHRHRHRHRRPAVGGAREDPHRPGEPEGQHRGQASSQRSTATCDDQTAELRDEESKQAQPRRTGSTRATPSSRPRSPTRKPRPPRSRRSTTRRSRRRRRRRAKAELERERAPRCRRPQPRRRRTHTRTSNPGQIVANPGGGSFMCPVFGAAYTDDFGGPTRPPRHRHVRPDRHPGVRGEVGDRALRAQRGRGRQHRVPVGRRREHVLLRAPLPVRGRSALGVTGRGDRPHRDDRQRDRSRISTSRSGSAATTASRTTPIPRSNRQAAEPARVDRRRASVAGTR